MKTIRFRSALPCALLAIALSASAQQMKVESQGEAEVATQKEALVAMSMARAIGQPASGKAQVVFFRSATSPGAALGVQADGEVVGELPSGMYFTVPAAAGTHAYAAAGARPLSMAVTADKTYYVQVIRDRAGRAQLLRSNASRFERATR